MKYLPLLLIFPLVSAVTYKEIEIRAHELKGRNDYDTVRNMEEFVSDNFNYSFYWFPQGETDYYKTRKGDCTEKAMLITFMLKTNGIKARTVHGIADGSLHDWYEVRINKEWETPDRELFDILFKVGYDVW